MREDHSSSPYPPAIAFKSAPAEKCPPAPVRIATRISSLALISSQASRNPMMAVNQVSVTMKFTLYGNDGRLISDTEASSDSAIAVSVERRLKHPAVIAICEQARKDLFA